MQLARASAIAIYSTAGISRRVHVRTRAEDIADQLHHVLERNHVEALAPAALVLPIAGCACVSISENCLSSERPTPGFAPKPEVASVGAAAANAEAFHEPVRGRALALVESIRRLALSRPQPHHINTLAPYCFWLFSAAKFTFWGAERPVWRWQSLQRPAKGLVRLCLRLRLRLHPMRRAAHCECAVCGVV